MKIFITGGTGFVGTTLTGRLAEHGHEVTVLTRRISGDPIPAKGVTLLEGDPTRPGAWQEEVSRHETIINLAGASIFRRWTKKAKAMIRESRVLTTKNLVNAMEARQGNETTLISTSAVGYYGFHDDEELDESRPPGDDFLASLAGEWEAEALRAQQFGVQVLICRLGIVMGAKGGALGQMIPLFRRGLGSALGSGEQWFSWIHEQDLIRIYLFLMDQKDLRGPVNCTAPNPIRNREFTKALGKALKKPTFMPAVPGFILGAVKGEFGNVLLKGQRVIPRKLLNAGFEFQFARIDEALQDLVG
ncbi:MAG: TIGR01777 family oxidoreductase [Desulfatiglans sp.]|jgi:uncharacterized protein (TIGR01777 family)|nr:TIGR01777 family oxidoreductase [Thermodesulfobacteriota bacterium]MEE4352433.1 TIGR01777 family oxidoreductase [Desulfatiglans sp.]